MSAEGRLALLAAGGTGGHMFPAEALASELKRRGWRIALVTDARGERYAADFPCDEKHFTDAATFAGRGPLGKLAAGAAILRGVFGAMGLVGRLKPAVAVGFGGYPSFPAMAAARLKGVPTCVHEQNAILGRVNRALAPHVTRIASAFRTVGRVPEGAKHKVTFVGNPVRPAVAAAAAPFRAPEAGAPLNLLIFGGSQGARLFAETAPAAVAALPEEIRRRLNVVHQARDEDAGAARAAYAAAGVDAELAPFFKDLPARIAAAHLVLSRAGASTVTELGVLARPAVLTPLGIAMDDHQTENAKILTNAGAAELLPESAFTAEGLAAILARLLGDPAGLAQMSAKADGVAPGDAAARLADMVEEIAKVT